MNVLMCNNSLFISTKAEGFEPSMSVLETDVLPLNYALNVPFGEDFHLTCSSSC